MRLSSLNVRFDMDDLLQVGVGEIVVLPELPDDDGSTESELDIPGQVDLPTAPIFELEPPLTLAPTGPTAGNDTLVGTTGDDTISGLAGNDSLRGGDGDDDLFGNSGNDTLAGNAGDDRLEGDAGNDSLGGGAGDDRLNGSFGNDTLVGGKGRDVLTGGSGDDRLVGKQGTDVLFGNSGDDLLRGSRDNDALFGGGDNDRLFGGTDNDGLFGEGGQDVLRGGRQNDRLLGGSGQDTLNGGVGNDQLVGGEDADLFVFDQAGGSIDSFIEPGTQISGGSGRDQIDDFTPGEDVVLLTATVNGLTLTSVGDILARIEADGPEDSTINLGGDNQIRLIGVRADDLSASDFLLV